MAKKLKLPESLVTFQVMRRTLGTKRRQPFWIFVSMFLQNACLQANPFVCETIREFFAPNWSGRFRGRAFGNEVGWLISLYRYCAIAKGRDKAGALTEKVIPQSHTSFAPTLLNRRGEDLSCQWTEAVVANPGKIWVILRVHAGVMKQQLRSYVRCRDGHCSTQRRSTISDY